jgi:hypothetical protein
MIESILLSVAVGELGNEDTHAAILESIRRRFSSTDLVRAAFSETSRLQLLKLGELASSGHAEAVLLRISTPSDPTPKIRLNLQEFPFSEAKIMDADYTAMTSVWMKLVSTNGPRTDAQQRHALAWPFRQPVDPIKDGASE